MATKKRASAPVQETTRVDDVVLVHGCSEDGKTIAVVRKRGDKLSAGVLRAVEEGKPVLGELLRLTPRAETPAICDVDVLHAPRVDAIGAANAVGAAGADEAAGADDQGAESDGRGGPSRSATPAYRSGWDAIWGARNVRGSRASRLN